VAKIPVDIVGAMLKHKNLDVTDYYSQPTHGILADAVDNYLFSIAAHVNVRQAVTRSPQELHELIEEAQDKYGTFTNVVGGTCVIHAPCIGKFACIGCPGLVPDPEKRPEVEWKKGWAQGQREMAAQYGLPFEVKSMERLERDCELILREMDQIEAYRSDEKRVALVQITRRR
jgi:hypothetical protein